MGHGIDELSQKIDLRSLHQAGHHNGEADPHRHATHADQCLSNASGHMSPRDTQQKIRRHGFYL
jgi:hypothetical protein